MAIEKDWITQAGLRAVCYDTGTHRCGYVAVPAGHPLHGAQYCEECDALAAIDTDNMIIGKRGALLAFTASVGASTGKIRRSPDVVFDVHGGLTFSRGKDYPAQNDAKDLWWFGFDCAHAGDGTYGSMRPRYYSALRPRHDEYGPIRSVEYVVAECESLAAQIVALFPGDDNAKQ